jgi:iron(III) transport system permease protein
MGAGWIMALGRDAVVTNNLRLLLGDDASTIYLWPMAAGATGLRYFALAAMIVASARGTIEQSRIAETVFSVSFRSRLRLRFSALRASFIASWLILIVLIFSDHILPGLFLIHTFGTEVLIQYNALMNPAGAAVLAMIPTVLSLAAATMVMRVLLRRAWTDRQRHEARANDRWPLAWLAIIIAVILPLLGLMVKAQGVINLATAWQDARAETIHSIWLSLVAACISVLVSLPLVRAALRAHYEGRGTFVWSILTNLVVPGSLLALGIVSLAAFRPFRAIRDTEIPLIFGYVARFAPIALLLLFLAWLRLPHAADLAGQIHCRSKWGRFTRVTLPPRAPALTSAFTVAILLTAAELEISLILVRPGPTTLGVRLYSLIHTAPDAIVSSLACDILLLVLVVIIGALLLRQITMLRRNPA